MSFRLAIVVLLYYVPSLLFSDLSASVRDSVDFYMSRLDAVLEEKDGYERLRLDKIADAKKQLHSLKETDTAKLYGLYTTLFDQYQYLCFDSAFVYAKKYTILRCVRIMPIWSVQHYLCLLIAMILPGCF